MPARYLGSFIGEATERDCWIANFQIETGSRYLGSFIDEATERDSWIANTVDDWVNGGVLGNEV